MSLRCRACGSTAPGAVVDSRAGKDGIRRRRECKCGERYTTREIDEGRHRRLVEVELLASDVERIGARTADLSKSLIALARALRES